MFKNNSNQLSDLANFRNSDTPYILCDYRMQSCVIMPLNQLVVSQESDRNSIPPNVEGVNHAIIVDSQQGSNIATQSHSLVFYAPVYPLINPAYLSNYYNQVVGFTQTGEPNLLLSQNQLNTPVPVEIKNNHEKREKKPLEIRDPSTNEVVNLKKDTSEIIENKDTINENTENNVQNKKRYDLNFLLSLRNKNTKIPPGMLRLPKCILNDIKTDDEKCLDELRLILNKLAPDNLTKLINEIDKLKINENNERLEGTIDIIFEKSITEPGFSELYAKLCKHLEQIEAVNAGGKKFRQLLLHRCQKLFETGYYEGINCSGKQAATYQNIDENIRKQKEEVDETLWKAKKRSLGNIRFIGELFKLKMLNENIIYDCVHRLLDPMKPDEEKIECLCKLLTTIGKIIDTKKSLQIMNEYFKDLKSISNSNTISSRIRFMILDLFDLRKNEWVPRHTHNILKKREDVHQEYEEEQKQHAQENRLQPLKDKMNSNQYYKQNFTAKHRINLKNINSKNLTSINEDLKLRPASFNKSHTDGQIISNIKPNEKTIKDNKTINKLGGPLSVQQCRDITKPSSTSTHLKKQVTKSDMTKEYNSNVIERKVFNLIEEYAQNNDLNEALNDIEDFQPVNPEQIEEFVRIAIQLVLERSKNEAKSIGNLFYHALKEKKLNFKHFINGLKAIFNSAEDTAVDVPLSAKYLGELLSSFVQPNFDINFFNELLAQITNKKIFSDTVSQMLICVANRLDYDSIFEIFKSSNVNIALNEYLKP